jgi:hypothetical protein
VLAGQAVRYSGVARRSTGLRGAVAGSAGFHLAAFAALWALASSQVHPGSLPGTALEPLPEPKELASPPPPRVRGATTPPGPRRPDELPGFAQRAAHLTVWLLPTAERPNLATPPEGPTAVLPKKAPRRVRRTLAPSEAAPSEPTAAELAFAPAPFPDVLADEPAPPDVASPGTALDAADLRPVEMADLTVAARAALPAEAAPSEASEASADPLPTPPLLAWADGAAQPLLAPPDAAAPTGSEEGHEQASSALALAAPDSPSPDAHPTAPAPGGPLGSASVEDDLALVLGPDRLVLARIVKTAALYLGAQRLRSVRGVELVLRFRLDPNGYVQGVVVQQATGIADLDQAFEVILHLAEPFPVRERDMEIRVPFGMPSS